MRKNTFIVIYYSTTNVEISLVFFTSTIVVIFCLINFGQHCVYYEVLLRFVSFFYSVYFYIVSYSHFFVFSAIGNKEKSYLVIIYEKLKTL